MIINPTFILHFEKTKKYEKILHCALVTFVVETMDIEKQKLKKVKG